MEGFKSTPVSNGVPPLSRISYVLSKNKQTLCYHTAKLFGLSLVLYLVEFVPTGQTISKRTIGGGRGPAREVNDFSSENSTSAQEYSESCHTNLSPAFASELRHKNCGLNLAWEAGIRQCQKTFSTTTAWGKHCPSFSTLAAKTTFSWPPIF